MMGIVEALGIDFAFASRSIYIESMPATEFATDDQIGRTAQTQADAQPAPGASLSPNPEPPPAAAGSAES